MRLPATALALALLGFTVPAADAQMRDPSAGGIHYKVDGMERAVVRANLVYKNVPSLNGSAGPVDLELDAYIPPALAARGRAPALVFVHGGNAPGGPPLKGMEAYTSWGRVSAASGLVGIAFNHRMTTRDNVEEASSDLADLLSYVRANADTLRIDPERICIAFFSAGGPISASILRDTPPSVRCVVLYYPYLDLAHLEMKTPFRDPYPAGTVTAKKIWSPTEALATHARPLPPIFLARAGRDQIPYLNASIARFMDAAMQHEVQIDFYLHPVGQHGFDFANRDDRTRDIIAATLAFVKRHTEN